MLYYLFHFLDKTYDFPGAGLFEYISFRSALAIIASLAISLIYGKKIINLLKKKQIGEDIRELGLDGQAGKKGTPTMGGIIIILGVVVPVLLFTKLDNIYVILLLVSTLWMGFIGFIDDYIKVFKKNKKGLHSKFKMAGQIGLGLLVGIVLHLHPQVVTKEFPKNPGFGEHLLNEKMEASKDLKSTKTTIPFLKNNELDYGRVLSFLGEDYSKYAWIIFIPIAIFIITAVSNATNLTDGLDGLAAGSSVIALLPLGIFAWVSGNIIFSKYLNIMYIPHVGEVAVFISAFMGALIGFLWYNSFPAQVFMGDTGSLTVGSIIAVIALAVRKELMLPILCGVFMIETLSVMIQVAYFKYTKRRFGVGRRVFLMSPLHHHYQKKGIHETKIVFRFLIIGVLLAVLTVVTLKVR